MEARAVFCERNHDRQLGFCWCCRCRARQQPSCRIFLDIHLGGYPRNDERPGNFCVLPIYPDIDMLYYRIYFIIRLNTLWIFINKRQAENQDSALCHSAVEPAKPLFASTVSPGRRSTSWRRGKVSAGRIGRLVSSTPTPRPATWRENFARP
ncbi:hypothetical protein ACCAA_1170027 [Candidatus Accumulibacter aalborgensis]|uniref:Uncharacterized protein n=1 Tax=Candidatus Accumulibacter aalborgensis TaxID=1860102 RepID=A0A1A8XGQ5_9PROT|nr:hypothetical protein ACCAA_1170027 [Candidatus Accumulibacter aalborgensis]